MRRSSLPLSDNRLTTVVGIRIFSGSLHGPMVGIFLSKESSDTNHIRSSLAGMVHKVGLLPPYNWRQIPSAYKMYTRMDKFGWAQSNQFKHALSIDVKINFLGLWCVNTVYIVFFMSVDVHIGIRVLWVLYVKSKRRQPLTSASPTFGKPSLSMNIAPNSMPNTTGNMLLMSRRFGSLYVSSPHSQPGLIYFPLGMPHRFVSSFSCRK